MVTVKINGKEITVEDNTLILDAARDAGYEVPTFCHQADLMGIGSCRMCLVEIEGQKKLQPSCVTPVLHGMSILTETPTVMSARAGVLEFLLANHAMDCPVCDKGGECELQDMVYKYGPHKGRHAEPKFKFHEKDYVLSPVIIKNSNRCVQCMKCVRVCREVVGRNVLGALNRGDHQEPTSFFRSFLDCDADGNCIEVCPVGCFMRLPYRCQTRPWDLKGADTICPYCATGCRMVVEHRDGKVIRAKAQLGVGLNSETLCARGRFGYDIINDAGRLTTPLVRRQKHGTLEPATWEEAFNIIKDNIPSLGGSTIGGIAGPRLTNEEVYLFQKLMRGVFATPNVDSSSRWEPDAVESFVAATGMAQGGVSVYDCMESDTVLIVGSHVSDENPVTDYIVRRISGNRRMNVIIASPRAMKLDSSANLTVRHYPAGEGQFLGAVASSLNAAGGAGLDALLKTAGVSAMDAEAVVGKLKASQSVAIFAGTEFLRYPHSIEPLAALKEQLRHLGKKVRVVPLLDRCNQRGAWEMGGHPSFAPGYVKAQETGLGVAGMLEAALNNRLDALYVAGADVAALYPDDAFAREGLTKVKFLVVQDAFLTETASMADVVLPGASYAEKDGMFTNQEGRAQIIRRLLPPPGKAKRDLDIIRAIGEMYDRSFGPKNAALVLDEIRGVNEMYADISLAFNNKRNIENKLDNRAGMVKGAKDGLKVKGFAPLAGAEDAQYPFLLATGNHLFHSGRLSGHSATLVDLMKSPAVEISEDDAARHGLIPGEKVAVSGRHFSATLTLNVRKGTRSGVAFIAENFASVPANRFFRRGEGAPRVNIRKA
ncbi:MAG: NADH-quinone oxidoreductase subunit NuoG [Deltaproteobacteria bacterium]|nr:NADH-quinone oxidoreductase subunit NuoG [Deltaproteobacteria bacterium]